MIRMEVYCIIFVVNLASQKTRSVTEYYKQLESSGWLKHVRCLLECGVFLAKSVTEGISCVVHCSDGWDRTAQTVSLAQLILDPFYRTILGFQVSFGLVLLFWFTSELRKLELMNQGYFLNFAYFLLR